MAQIVAGVQFPLNFDALNVGNVYYGTVLSESATAIVVNEGSGYIATLTGMSFVYDGLGSVQSGTLTGISETYNGSTTFAATGINFPAATFLQIAKSNNTDAALANILRLADRLEGSDFADTLRGYSGEDVIAGHVGGDLLYGGDGSDDFVGTLAEMNGDRVWDFARGDRLLFTDVFSPSSVSFTGSTLTVSSGSSTASLSVVGSTTLTLARALGPHGELEIVVKPTADGSGDLDGNGMADYLWRDASGALTTWKTVGGTLANQVQQSAYNGNVDMSWKIVETFDWNGDGKADILWRNTSGTFSIWNATSSGFTPGTYTNGSVGNNWRIAATGDFNGDGKDDLLWQQTDGSVSTWSANALGTGFATNTYFHGSPGAEWNVVQAADFDGDGKDDILWRNSAGAVSEWRSTGSGFTENSYFDSSVGNEWHIAGTGDFNGDGREDILWRSGDQVSIWEAASGGFDKNTFYQAGVARSWKVAEVVDLNGDGKADVVWRNDDGTVSTWVGTGTSFQEQAYEFKVAGSWNIQSHDFAFG